MPSPEHKGRRVAMVVPQLAQGGAEKQLVTLARGLRVAGECEPVVFCTSSWTQPYGEELDDAGVEWYSPGSPKRRGLPRLLWLLRRLRNARCDLVYGVLHVGNVYGGAAAMLLGLPFVASIRNTETSLPAVTRFLSASFCRRARVVVANSDSCTRSLRQGLRVRHERVFVIPNAVTMPAPTVDARERLRKAWGVPSDATLVGTLANLKPQKRVPFFVEVTARCLATEPNMHFVWVGDGPERGRVHGLLASLHASVAERIRFVGARKDVADCLAAFDVFVLTSAYEGMPNALLEAMAAGLPCVATDVPGTRDVLANTGDGEIGVLADAGDAALFSGTLLELLGQPERSRRMGENARRHVRARYSLEAMVNAFSEVFLEAVDSGW